MMIQFEIVSLILIFHLIIPFEAWIWTGSRFSLENNHILNRFNDQKYKQNSDDKEIKISKSINIVTDFDYH